MCRCAAFLVISVFSAQPCHFCVAGSALFFLLFYFVFSQVLHKLVHQLFIPDFPGIFFIYKGQGGFCRTGTAPLSHMMNGFYMLNCFLLNLLHISGVLVLHNYIELPVNHIRKNSPVIEHILQCLTNGLKICITCGIP